jgi:photosystem II stability/assembly factor-like uncharacterized protein
VPHAHKSISALRGRLRSPRIRAGDILCAVSTARWRLILAALACTGLAGGCTSPRSTPSASSHRSTTSTASPRASTTTSSVSATSGSVSASALSAGLEAIACPSTADCLAVGAQGFGTPGHEIAAVSSDGGSLWASTAPLSGVTHLDAMACPTPSSCLAVGSNLVGSSTEGVAVSTADGGHIWSTVSTLPSGVTQLKSVSCAITTSCMVVGTSTDEDRGVAFTTDVSGSTWNHLSLPDGQSDPSLVTCPTARSCVIEGSDESAVGDPSAGEHLSIITTSDGGTTWVRSTLPIGTSPGPPIYMGLTCSTPTRCFLVGDATPGDGSPSGLISASSDAGQSWRVVPPPAGATFLNAIACPTSANCVVVGGGIEARGGSDQDILTTSDGGQTWVSRPVPAGVTGLSAVSCSTTVSCVAVGFGPSNSPSGIDPVVAATSDSGATWTALG